MKKRLFCLVLILVVGLVVAACSKAPDEASPPTDFSGQTLSISVCYYAYNVEPAIQKFKALHPGVEIVLHNYNADFAKYRQQIGTELMAGESDDILDALGLRDVKISDSGYLADMYPLMANDPAFNEDDYFMNVFKAVEYQGKLMQFPVTFLYLLMGVNNMFSDDLVERYSEYETVSWQQLIDIYNSVADKDGFYAGADLDASMVVGHNLTAYIDFENKTCDFNNPEFIKLITDWKNATWPQKDLGLMPGTDFLPATQEAFAKQYLFQMVHSGQDSAAGFFPYVEKPAFTHYIPVVSKKDNLMISPLASYSISETCQNKELAWEFIKFLASPEVGQSAASFSTHKETFHAVVPVRVEEMIEYMRQGATIDGETAEIAAQVTEIFARYSEMPMEQLQPYLYSVLDMVSGIMANFYNGTMTAEQVASELQNKVSLYLME